MHIPQPSPAGAGARRWRSSWLRTGSAARSWRSRCPAARARRARSWRGAGPTAPASRACWTRRTGGARSGRRRTCADAPTTSRPFSTSCARWRPRGSSGRWWRRPGQSDWVKSRCGGEEGVFCSWSLRERVQHPALAWSRTEERPGPTFCVHMTVRHGLPRHRLVV